jgi:hypothetical protein
MTTCARPVSDRDESGTPAEYAGAETLRLAVLGHALALGIAGDFLMRDPGSGLAYPLWIALLALSAVALTWRRERHLAHEAALWLVTAVVFASFSAWRASEALLVMNLFATLGALGMAAVAIADANVALFAQRLRDTLWAGLDVARSVAAGLPPIVYHAMSAAPKRGPTGERVRPALRAALIAAVLLVLFGALLSSADPLFASFVELPDIDFGEIVSHTLVTGFYAWLAAGWVRGALRLDRATPRAPDALPITFSALDITAALSALVVLFSAYVVSQLGWYFGGEHFLHERTGLTAASYARQGFFQLVWVIALVLPVLMATRAGLPPRSTLSRRHTALSLPLIILLGATMISAVARMKLYVHYFGLTSDRLYPFVFMGWLAVVLLWFAFTVLRDWPRPFVAGALLTGAFTLAALNISDPDAFVARVNIRHAAQNPARADAALDIRYLATLSGAAVPIAVRATLDPQSPATAEQRCDAVFELLRRWGPQSSLAARYREDNAWRRWNVDEAEGMRVVAASARELRTLAHQTCTRRPKAAEH